VNVVEGLCLSLLWEWFWV